jgi:methyltransferase-like protein
MVSTGKGVVSKINGALEFAQKLLDTNPMFARANPSVVDRLKKVASQDRHYLAHEYFNKDWHPMHFATMSQWLSPAKIDFACSAHYLDHIDALNLSAEQQRLLKEIPDATFKESVRDFMVNQQFRRDYWIKGARKLSVIEQAELIKRHKLVLTSSREDISLKISGSLGEASMSEAIYAPILDLMSDHKTRSIEEIASKVKDKSVNFSQVVQAAMVLVGAGHIASVQSESQIAKAKHATAKLNEALIDKARFSAEITFLASPVTGGGIAVNRFQQLFLLAMRNGKKQPQEWASEVWSVLAAQNQRLLKEGKTLESAEDNIQELVNQANDFARKRLPILKALEIV